jgi:hypothetical protein
MDLGCVEYQPDLVLGRTKESKQAKKDCDGACRAWAALRGFLDMNIMYNVQVQRGDGVYSITIHALLTHWMSVLRIAKTEYKRWAQGTR